MILLSTLISLNLLLQPIKNSVLLVGDSLAEGISPFLFENLKDKAKYDSLYKRGTTVPYWNSNKKLEQKLKQKPSIILVSLGTNDLKTKPLSLDKYFNFTKKLVDSGAQVYWIIPPVMPFHNEDIIDFIEHPPDGVNKIECPNYERAPDKIHLSAKGYKDWAGCISDSLDL